MPRADPHEDPAVALFFSVNITNYDLGVFTSCEGLGVEVAVKPLEEGGQNFYVHQLPGRMKYTNIKLSRPVNSDSAVVARWFASMASGVKKTDATITALTAHGRAIVSWNLLGVFPVRWTGPSFSTDSAKTVTETIELAHNGFLGA